MSDVHHRTPATQNTTSAMEATDMTIITTTEIIDPTRAKAMLETMNHSNRPLRRERVRRYAHEMHRGNWRLTGEPIIISSADEILSGQHRLAACIEAGVPFETAVARGVDGGEARPLIDSGLPRTLADALSYYGVTRTNEMAAAVGAILRFQRHLLRDTTGALTRISRDEQVDFTLAHADALTDAVRKGWRIRKSIGMSSSTWAALCFLTAEVAPDISTEFTDRLIDGVSLPEKSPIGALRRWATNNVVQGKRRPQWEQITAFIKAWNAHVKGEDISIIKIGVGEDVPEIFTP